MAEKRNDTRCAVFVDAGIRVNTLWGCVSAWHYMRQRGVEREVAFRVLSPLGIHRSTDAPHPAARDKLAAQPDTGTDHEDVLRRVRDEMDVPQSRRANDVTAAVCERAIAFAETHGTQYAESMLRIYGLKTATVMRVLFEPRSRRRCRRRP